jgi:hypothetical protein
VASVDMCCGVAWQNLCHDWLASYLPHVLVKIDRVTFGQSRPVTCWVVTMMMMMMMMMTTTTQAS